MGWGDFSEEAAFFAAELEVLLQTASPGLAPAVAPHKTAPTTDELDRQYERLRADRDRARQLAQSRLAHPREMAAMRELRERYPAIARRWLDER